jgi:hypothetical protein
MNHGDATSGGAAQAPVQPEHGPQAHRRLETTSCARYGVLMQPRASRTPRRVIEGAATRHGHWPMLTSSPKHLHHAARRSVDDEHAGAELVSIHGPAGVSKTALVERGIAKPRAALQPHQPVRRERRGVPAATTTTYQGRGRAASSEAHGDISRMTPSSSSRQARQRCLQPERRSMQALMFPLDPAQNRFNDIYVGITTSTSRRPCLCSRRPPPGGPHPSLDRMTVVETRVRQPAPRRPSLQKHAAPECCRDSSGCRNAEPAWRRRRSSAKMGDTVPGRRGHAQLHAPLPRHVREESTCNILGTTAARPRRPAGRARPPRSMDVARYDDVHVETGSLRKLVAAPGVGVNSSRRTTRSPHSRSATARTDGRRASHEALLATTRGDRHI